MAEQRFDFLRELVKNLPDISLADEAAANYNEIDDVESSPEQDSFSDAATEHNQCSDIIQTSSTSMTRSATTLNGLNLKLNGENDGKLRRTRSMQQFELQQEKHANINLDIWEHLYKNPSGGMSNNLGVIMHTNKFVRTESAPNAESCTVPKRPRQTATTTTSAKSKSTAPSTASAVSYDLDQPVLKFDYSNINVPQSAPAQIVPPIFDFSQLGSQPPISINIDLSSININKSSNSTVPSHTDSVNNSAKSGTGTIPKADVKPNKSITLSKPIIATKDTLLELDEDYDNI